MTWQERTEAIKVGDNVAFSAAFLKNTGQQTGDVPFARGVVKELQPLGGTMLATVEWDNPEIGKYAVVCNLARVGGKGFALD